MIIEVIYSAAKLIFGDRPINPNIRSIRSSKSFPCYENILLFFISILFLVPMSYGQLIVKNLRMENRVNPLGIDVLNPRFSWQLVSDQRNVCRPPMKSVSGQDPGKMISGTAENGRAPNPHLLLIRALP